MPELATNAIMVPIDQIEVRRDERQRKQLDDEGLQRSIARNGLIQPIVVMPQDITAEKAFLLIAGERRLTSCKALGWTSIPARQFYDLDIAEQRIIEFEENLKRKDLSWQERVAAVAELHALMLERDPDWFAQSTAELVGLTPPQVSKILTVATSLADENVAKCGTMEEALNVLERRRRRAQGNALEELLGFAAPAEEQGQAEARSEAHADDEPDLPFESEGLKPQLTGEIVAQPAPAAALPSTPSPAVPSPAPRPAYAPHRIIAADFTQWASTYSGPRFNFIHCDFPYGLNLFANSGVRTGPAATQMGYDEGESYDDSPEVYDALIAALVANAGRLLAESAHIMFWLSNKFEIEQRTRAALAPLGFTFSRYPLIWHKTDNVGIAAAPQYEPRHVYEYALLGYRAKRTITKVVSDCYGCPTDKSLHQSCKPESMLKHFFCMLVDAHTVMLDPTCGSGTSIRAAEALGAKSALGLEIDPKMAELAQQRLVTERTKRLAAATLGK